MYARVNRADGGRGRGKGVLAEQRVGEVGGGPETGERNFNVIVLNFKYSMSYLAYSRFGPLPRMP